VGLGLTSGWGWVEMGLSGDGLGYRWGWVEILIEMERSETRNYIQAANNPCRVVYVGESMLGMDCDRVQIYVTMHGHLRLYQIFSTQSAQRICGRSSVHAHSVCQTKPFRVTRCYPSAPY
jgi:hypothetical protein